MKHNPINPNNRKLAEYFENNRTIDETGRKKITFVVEDHYAALLSRLSMLLGNSKTKTFRVALDHLAELCESNTDGTTNTAV